MLALMQLLILQTYSPRQHIQFDETRKAAFFVISVTFQSPLPLAVARQPASIQPPLYSLVLLHVCYIVHLASEWKANTREKKSLAPSSQ